MNTSTLLVVSGLAEDYLQGTQLARESVKSGKAWKALENFRDFGRENVISHLAS